MPATLRRLLLLVCLGTTIPPDRGYAQFTREHAIAGLRGFHGPATRIRRSFESDDEARRIFKQVLAAAGLAGIEDRISFRASAETANAEAGIEAHNGREDRYIFYNAVFMREISAQTSSYWSLVAILAHEVGHHVRFHTVTPGRDHEFELEADYQAGFILRRMGATLEEAQAVYRMFPEAETPTHPGRAQRLQSVTLGWSQGLGGAAPTPHRPRRRRRLYNLNHQRHRRRLRDPRHPQHRRPPLHRQQIRPGVSSPSCLQLSVRQGMETWRFRKPFGKSYRAEASRCRTDRTHPTGS